MGMDAVGSLAAAFEIAATADADDKANAEGSARDCECSNADMQTAISRTSSIGRFAARVIAKLKQREGPTMWWRCATLVIASMATLGET